MPGCPHPRTPDDVIVSDIRANRRDDPTVGEEIGPPSGTHPKVPDAPARKLVAIGDSMTHGVTSGAVFFTDRSWPALVAETLKLPAFPAPSCSGPLDGLPLNLERLARRLGETFGSDLSLFEKLRLPIVLRSLLDDNEDYWEREAGGQPPSTDVRYPDLGIDGWDVRDALS